MYFQRKSKVKQNRPSFCNYHHGSHATAPRIRFTPRNYILNLLAVGMENLLCNGKGAPYFGRVEFERGLCVRPCRCGPNGVDTIFRQRAY